MNDNRDLQARLQDMVDDHVGITQTEPSEKLCDILDAHLGKTRIAHSKEVQALRYALANVLVAMKLWGAEGDGIPEDGPIAIAFGQAEELLRTHGF